VRVLSNSPVHRAELAAVRERTDQQGSQVGAVNLVPLPVHSWPVHIVERERYSCFLSGITLWHRATRALCCATIYALDASSAAATRWSGSDKVC
jgi:hypothetical protein